MDEEKFILKGIFDVPWLPSFAVLGMESEDSVFWIIVR